jgi:signal transduction histidine kinase
MSSSTAFRILVIDDDANIQRDFARVFAVRAPPPAELIAAQVALFGPSAVEADAGLPSYELEFAHQGQQGLEQLRRAADAGRSFALAFVDMRMPPGWDGLRTIEELWKVEDDLQVVLCTAYSELSLAEVARRLGHPDRLLVLKKPFDPVEVEQLAAALTAKWKLAREQRQRTAELVEACASARQAAAAKGQFLANMSHEIRTPLTGILGFAQLLRREDLPRDQQLAFLESICRSGQHLLQVLSDVLDASRLESGRIRLERLEFSPLEVLRDARAALLGLAVEKELPLELDCQGDFPDLAEGDPTRLRQILLNLVGNAVKFTERGRVRVVARANPAAEQGWFELEVCVEDTGQGIPADQIERLFAPFTQGDDSMTRRFGGSGLGLSISRHLANAMGGGIEVESEVERGSRFTLTVRLQLPKTAKWGAVGAKSTAREPRPAVPSRTQQRLAARVLLVDDTRDNQLLVSLMLRRAGAVVEIARDGVEGLECWERAVRGSEPFDLIVTDMQMPRLDGYGLAHALRQAGCRAPILALTAHALPEDRQRCLAAGCDDYVTKPVAPEPLVAACGALLARADAPLSSGPAPRE